MSLYSILKLLSELAAKGFWGKVEIELEKGRVTQLHKTEGQSQKSAASSI